MNDQRRVFLIVMDGCGIGRAYDLPGKLPAGVVEPEGWTIPHVAEFVGGLHLPSMERLGLGRIAFITGLNAGHTVIGSYGAARIASAGKDSVTGHWEMAGIQTLIPFPLYPQGFPPEVIEPFEKHVGHQVLGNMAASGTEIIQRFGAEHMQSGMPIVYTSADSVMQIAAHEEIIPLDALYEMCAYARSILVAPNNVQRVIARPFVGNTESGFKRTEHRRDFPLTAPAPNLISVLNEAKRRTHAIGVVAELFPGTPFTIAQRTQSNAEHLAAIRKAVIEGGAEFVFANCEDFDMLYGHRNDAAGFARALEEFDTVLGDIIGHLRSEDLLMITADHGNDPTTPSTDHSREDVPLLAYSPSMAGGVDFGLRETLADIAATTAAWLGVEWDGVGTRVI